MHVALPAKARAVLYYVTFIVGLVLGATQVGYAAAEFDQPTWLTVALAVFAFLGSGLGLTAASNTPVVGDTVVAGEANDLLPTGAQVRTMEPRRAADEGDAL